MKRLLLGLLSLLIFAGISWGRNPTEFMKEFTVNIYPSLFSDSLYDTTLIVDLQDAGNLGKFCIEVSTDSIAGFEGELDSTFIRYRPGHRVSSNERAYIESDGTEADWEYLQIYDGGTTFSDFDIGTVGVDNRRFLCTIEQGELPWPDLMLISVQHIDDNGTVNDSGLVYITIYRSKD